MSTALIGPLAAVAAILGGLVLARRTRPSLLLGPLGILLWHAWDQGVVPPWLVFSVLPMGLLAAFLAECDRLCTARRSRALFLLLCGGAGTLFWDRTEGLWAAERELGSASGVERDGVVIQTTGYSCVPASAATCLKRLGIAAGEAELAREAGTGTRGTSFGRIQWAIGRRLKGSGWALRHAGKARWEDLPRDGSPALLDIELGGVGSGGVKHAVAFLGFLPDGSARVGDPLAGTSRYTRAELEAYWAGEAVFFVRP